MSDAEVSQVAPKPAGLCLVPAQQCESAVGGGSAGASPSHNVSIAFVGETLKLTVAFASMLFYADPVTFYSTVCSYRTMEYAQASRWILMEPAELLFSFAAQLVYSGDKGEYS